jgi:SAM-dependent methyltransferase
VQDADLEYNPSDLGRLLSPLENGLADAVFGSRFASSDAHRVLYFWHSVGNRFLTLLSNMFTNLNLTDMETCYKVIRKEILDELPLFEDRFGFEPEITAKLAQVGARVYEVGISYNGRTYQEGKKIGWKDGFRAIYVIIKYANLGSRFVKRHSHLDQISNENFSEIMDLENLQNFRNYNHWIYSRFKPYLKGKILDLGSGSGNLAQLFIKNANSLTLVEPAQNPYQSLVKKFSENDKTVSLFNLQIDKYLLSELEDFDTITMTNVLEHLKYQNFTLKLIRNKLKQNGYLILFVPAFEFLYSQYDLSIGHYRRYTKKSLKQLIIDNECEIIDVRYFNFIGFFGWLFQARILRRNPTKSKFVNYLDKYLVPIMNSVEKWVTIPLGQSLFVVLKPINKDR